MGTAVANGAFVSRYGLKLISEFRPHILLQTIWHFSLIFYILAVRPLQDGPHLLQGKLSLGEKVKFSVNISIGAVIGVEDDAA